MSEELWQRVERHLRQVEKPSRYIDHEFGITVKDSWDYHAVMIYPDTYEIGQSNQGLAIIRQVLNEVPGIYCERGYLPWTDMADIMRAERIPLFSLETYTPIADFDLLGFTLPHEMAISNVLECLDLAQLPLLASERGEDAPIVIAGGPCTYNPEPFVDFIDAFMIGEGEELDPEVAILHRRLRDEGKSKREILEAMAGIEGVYVPSLFERVSDDSYQLRCTVPGLPDTVRKRVYAQFAQVPPDTSPIVPFVEATHDRLSIEVLRGCARGCRFCQAGMIYRPVRERTADQVVASVINGLACTGYDEVSLTSLSTTDHSQLESILRRLNSRLDGSGIAVSIPSQRLDAFGVAMAELVAGNKKGGLTFAPEAGTQRLRDIINKGVTQENLVNAIQRSFDAGWRRVKLYFMCGLPLETDDDLRGIGQLAGLAYETARDAVPQRDKGSVKVSLSCAVFVPKTHTPFQWCGQIPRDEVKRRINVIRSSIPYRAIDFRWHDPGTSLLEAVISRGDRSVGKLIKRAWELGARFDAWTDQFHFEYWAQAAQDLGYDLQAMASRSYTVDEVLPWQHIDAGVTWRYLQREWDRAQKGITTPDCTFHGCTGCGICQRLGCENVLAGERDG
ncbi:MAG: TIGR03960 family B12-binding radical SAM protein [Coriobacteriales bacterium]|nr:TIGR03960 family B12-binding radical SAM protein [Coriobacteriales bacterium]